MTTPATIDFGAPEEFGSHVFRVELPVARGEMVRIVEDFGYDGGDAGRTYEEERAIIPRACWSVIGEAAKHDFNDRLKAAKQSTSRWRTGTTKVERLLGKELCVLAWAAEDQHQDVLPIVCSRWLALRPEERWWLFAVTVAEAGLPEDKDRGWRIALRSALSDGERMTAESRRRRRQTDPNRQLTLPGSR